jgi:hypothetical protein
LGVLTPAGPVMGEYVRLNEALETFFCRIARAAAV